MYTDGSPMSDLTSSPGTLSCGSSKSTKNHHLNKLYWITTQMLHTKSKGHPLSHSGEDFKVVFLPYMGMAAILVM